MNGGSVLRPHKHTDEIAHIISVTMARACTNATVCLLALLMIMCILGERAPDLAQALASLNHAWGRTLIRRPGRGLLPSSASRDIRRWGEALAQDGKQAQATHYPAK